MRHLWDRVRTWIKGGTFYQLKPEHRVKEAFILNGVQYFQFDDSFSMPCDRAFSAMDFYEELNMRCTREYLQAHVSAIDSILSGEKFALNELTQIKQFNEYLKERLDYIHDAELIYKLASVTFFDSSENPYKYDQKYGQEKIRKWKEHDVADFFLQTPIRELLPWPDISATDLRAYTKTVEELSKEQISHLLRYVSQEQKSREWYSTLASQSS